jgi:hypothetical protein
MKLLAVAALSLGFVFSLAQGHNESPAPTKLNDVGFLVGKWAGKQNFHMDNGQTMSADITLTVTQEVGGRFIQEKSTTTLPGGRTGSAVHMLSFDPKAGIYKVWWFNDTSPNPQSLQGSFDGTKLVMMTAASEGYQGPTFRATYEKASDSAFNYQLELKNGDSWRTLFVTNYTRQH